MCQASLYAGQFLKNENDCFEKFTLSARSMLLVGGGGKCSNNADADDDNDDVQSFGVV